MRHDLSAPRAPHQCFERLATELTASLLRLLLL
jgi:hypothetical protein